MRRLFFETPLTFQQMLFTARSAKSSGSYDTAISKSAFFLKTEIENRFSNQLQFITLFPSKPQIINRLIRPMEQILLDLKNIPNQPTHVENITSVLQRYREISSQSIEDTLSGLKDMVEAKARTATTNYEERIRNLEHFISSSEMTDLKSLLDSLLFTNFVIQLMIDQHNYICSLQKNNSSDSEGEIISERIERIIQFAIEDATAASIDKTGVSPKVELMGKLDDKIVCAPHLVHFIMTEVLKNSIRAVVEHRGAMASELPPIKIEVFSKTQNMVIRVSDAGGGIPFHKLNKIFHYFYTTVPYTAPTYTYSGNFGSPFHGLGVGLPISRLYSRLMGGDLRLESLIGKGTESFIYLNKNGTSPLIFNNL